MFPTLSRTKTIIEGIEWLDQDGPVFQRSNRMWKKEGFYAEREFWLGASPAGARQSQRRRVNECELISRTRSNAPGT